MIPSRTLNCVPGLMHIARSSPDPISLSLSLSQMLVRAPVPRLATWAEAPAAAAVVRRAANLRAAANGRTPRRPVEAAAESEGVGGSRRKILPFLSRAHAQTYTHFIENRASHTHPHSPHSPRTQTKCHRTANQSCLRAHPRQRSGPESGSNLGFVRRDVCSC